MQQDGMNVDPTLAFADLQPDDILDSLEHIGFHCDGRFLALNSYENRVYRIGIEDEEPVVAKFYRPGRWSDDAILEEHSFTAELEAQEIPVVAPLNINGNTLHHRGPFRFSVSPCRGGRAPELDDVDLQKQLGRLVARIHLQGEIRPFQHRPAIDINTYGVESADFLMDEEFIPVELIDNYEGIIEHLLDNVSACYERAGNVRNIRLHADFHPSNLLVNLEQLHIVDLDDARSGPSIQDLWMFLSGDRNEQQGQLTNLLDGYQEFRQFDAREINLIEALRSLRMLHYAAWVARRWEDPAFKIAFPWFDTGRYWDEHILMLREQTALMQEQPLEWIY
jgi:Ser/Thr protein kinase RdoA (MazF antagonist)